MKNIMSNDPKDFQYHKKRHADFLKSGGANQTFFREYSNEAIIAMAKKFYPWFSKRPVKIVFHNLFFYGYIQHRADRMLDMVKFIEPWVNRKTGETGSVMLSEVSIDRDKITPEDVRILEARGMKFQKTNSYLKLKNLEFLSECGD